MLIIIELCIIMALDICLVVNFNAVLDFGFKGIEYLSVRPKMNIMLSAVYLVFVAFAHIAHVKAFGLLGTCGIMFIYMVSILISAIIGKRYVHKHNV